MLDKAIEKLPNYNEIVYSGQKFPEELLEKLKTEKYIEFDDLLSTSRIEEKAISHLSQNNGNVILHVDGYSGKSIEKASSFETEAEVLFDSQATYEIKKWEYIQHPTKPEEKILYVELIQQ